MSINKIILKTWFKHKNIHLSLSFLYYLNFTSLTEFTLHVVFWIKTQYTSIMRVRLAKARETMQTIEYIKLVMEALTEFRMFLDSLLPYVLIFAKTKKDNSSKTEKPSTKENKHIR